MKSLGRSIEKGIRVVLFTPIVAFLILYAGIHLVSGTSVSYNHEKAKQGWESMIGGTVIRIGKAYLEHQLPFDIKL